MSVVFFEDAPINVPEFTMIRVRSWNRLYSRDIIHSFSPMVLLQLWPDDCIVVQVILPYSLFPLGDFLMYIKISKTFPFSIYWESIVWHPYSSDRMLLSQWLPMRHRWRVADLEPLINWYLFSGIRNPVIVARHSEAVVGLHLPAGTLTVPFQCSAH